MNPAHNGWRVFPLALVLASACATPPPASTVPEPERAPPIRLTERRTDEILVCGKRYSIGAPVVLWTDPGGYDAYSTELHFPDEPPQEAPEGLRYQPGRKAYLPDGTLDPRATSLLGTQRCFEELVDVLDQFVLHYDVCGTSRQCFKILHDRRKLSVHFMLDVDGTLYQTLDLSDTAWHARQANPRSVGIEIANIGAYPIGNTTLDEWYEWDEIGPRLTLPEWMKESGIRTPDFVARPARRERIVGDVHARTYEMYDLTREQHETLVKLTAALCELFPKLTPDAPRDAEGRVRWDALSDEEFRAYSGILGHYHITTDKQDPGPAFDWEVYLERVREELTREAD